MPTLKKLWPMLLVDLLSIDERTGRPPILKPISRAERKELQ